MQFNLFFVKVTESGKEGGLIVGKKHSEGGVKAIVDGKKPIEVEGGEVILSAKSMADPEIITVTGTKKEIASAINSDKGFGVEFKEGAEIEKVEFEEGGVISNDDKKDIHKRWKELVNMSSSELQKFYESKEGQDAGLSPSEAKSQGIDYGRESARWIFKMKVTPVSEWTDTMWKWAKKQISFISRMSANKGDLFDENGNKTRKHTSLLIWGHDPTKKEKFEAGGEIPNRIYLGEEGGSNISGKTVFDEAVKLEKTGFSNEEIRQKTGWFRNPFDKLWRYEINDSLSEINEKEFNAAADYVSANNSKKKSVAISSIYKNNNFYKAYPEAKGLRLKFEYNDQSEGIASILAGTSTLGNKLVIINYNVYAEPKWGVIDSGGRRLSSKIRAILNHELQHYVQIREGLSAGSSTDWEFEQLVIEWKKHSLGEITDVQENILKSQAARNLKNSAGEIEARDSERRMDYSDQRRMIEMPYGVFDYEKENVIVKLENFYKFQDGGEIPEGIMTFEIDENEENVIEREYTYGDTFETGGKLKVEKETAHSNSELEKGIRIEQEHSDTLNKVASGELSVEEGIEATAKDHLSELPEYYTELEKMENQIDPIEPVEEKTGKSIDPHKEVSASLKSAIQDVISVEKYRDLSEKYAELLYSLFKEYELLPKDEDDYIIEQYDLHEGNKDYKLIQSLSDLGYVYYFKYLDQVVTNQKAIDFINAVRGRLETRKNVKSGIDLFPETANIPEFMPKGIYKDIRSCLIEDGDDQNDYLVEGTVIYNKEKTDPEKWVVVEFFQNGLVLKYLPKSILTDAKVDKKISFSELKQLFQDGLVEIEGISDLKTLNLCIKAIKKCIAVIDMEDYKDSLLSRTAELEALHAIKESEFESKKAELEAESKSKDPKHFQEVEGIAVGQDYNHDLYGMVRVIDIVENFGDKKNKIPYVVEYETDWGKAGEVESGIESQGIVGFKTSISKENQLNQLIGKFVHEYTLGNSDPVISQVESVSVDDPKELTRNIILKVEDSEIRIPLSKLDDLLKGLEIETTDDTVIVVTSNVRVDETEENSADYQELVDAITGLEMLTQGVKGKEKKELLATIEGLKMLLSETPKAPEKKMVYLEEPVIDSHHYNEPTITWEKGLYEVVKEDDKSYVIKKEWSDAEKSQFGISSSDNYGFIKLSKKRFKKEKFEEGGEISSEKVLVNFHVSGGGGNNRKLDFVGIGGDIKDRVFNEFFPQEDGTYQDGGGNILDTNDNEGGYYVDSDGAYDTSYGTYISEWGDLNEEEQKSVMNGNWKFLEYAGIEIPEDDDNEEFEKGGEIFGDNKIITLFISSKSPLSNQLTKLTGNSYNSGDFEDIQGGSPNASYKNIIKHRATGKLFTTLNPDDLEKLGIPDPKHNLGESVSIIDAPKSASNKYKVVGHERWNADYGWETIIKNVDEEITMFENLIESNHTFKSGGEIDGISYEYRAERKTYSTFSVEELNQLSKEGWNLVDSASGGKSGWEYYFRRMKDSPNNLIYEYKTIQNTYSTISVSELDKLSKEGWELVDTASGNRGFEHYLRRENKDTFESGGEIESGMQPVAELK